MLLPHYVNLISAVHPILMPIIDKFSTRLAPGERRAVVANRGRIPITPIGVHDRARVREYTRSVHPFRNERFLARFSHRCALCGADLRVTGYHVDHILPFSRGGQSKQENVQPLCPPCNMRKGNEYMPPQTG
jgi:5-methylcytosine-specific restriction endonuclease McrA